MLLLFALVPFICMRDADEVFFLNIDTAICSRISLVWYVIIFLGLPGTSVARMRIINVVC